MKKQRPRVHRKKRIRKKIYGTELKPRVCVFRSNNHIFAQAVNDEKRITLTSASDLKVSNGKKQKPQEKAKVVGKALGEALKKQKIKSVVFDRSGYRYHGRVKALADGIREAGILL